MSLRLFARIISRNPEAYLLKIAAMSIAFATSIAIALFSIHEFGYDRFHDDAGNLFRVLEKNTSQTYTGNRLSAKIPAAIVDALNSPDYQDSLSISRVKIMKGVTVLTNGKSYPLEKIHAADPLITRIFSFEFLDGDANNFTVPNEPIAMVSSSIAATYWGTTHAVGKEFMLFTLGDTVRVRVAAIFRSFPQNTHENFDILLSFNHHLINSLNFDSGQTGVYGRTLKRSPESYELTSGQFAKQADRVYKLQPITGIYFGARVLGEAARHGDSYSVVTLICLTSLIFFLALTSFINLTTITLPHRSKELAVKKLSGTTQWQLIFGFTRESALLVGISLAIGSVMLLSCDDLLTTVLGFRVSSSVTQLDPALFLIVIVLFTILTLSPVLMTIKFVKASPTRLLTTDTITFPALKRYITLMQLGISIFLIIASVVVRRQINYTLVKEPGQNHDQIVYLNCPRGITNAGIAALRSGWRTYNPNILDVMAVSQLPDRISSKEIDSHFYQILVDAGFREFFNLRMERGYWFGPNSGDSASVINRKGQHLLSKADPFVLGVIEDLNEFFNQPAKPVRMRLGSDYHYNWLCVRVLEVDVRRTVNRLSEQFSVGEETAHVSYLNEHFKSWIDYQDRLNRLSAILTLISGLLSCCAIYGLSVSIVRDKLKEIAVHRLFGANTIHITFLLVIGFARQLVIALIVFLPFSYIVLNEMLRTFVYATSLSWLDPVYPLAYCVFVITAICGFQAWNLKRTDFAAALKG